ncbi:cytosolic factor, phosphatidylinositol/phosphatidylcholine transfer protein [Rhizoclosmatium sp. JEL0117]|nr:cytosolic factor, phosphatidylinositol/phosphatidylcholine transfer protein [Rhizoclosmatium sp. JEL0117]
MPFLPINQSILTNLSLFRKTAYDVGGVGVKKMSKLRSAASSESLVSSMENLNGRLGHLTPDQQAALDQMKKDLLELEGGKYYIPEKHTDHQLLRFLRARKFELVASKKMWIDSENWRASFGTDTIIETFDFPEHVAALKYYPRFYHKTDKVGRPIYIEQLGALKLAELMSVSTEQRMQRNHVHEYERLIKYRMVACAIKSGRHIEQSLVILDLKGIQLSTFSQVYGIVKSVSSIAQDYYPEMLGKMFVINAPMLFTGVWSLVKPMLDEATVQKINILGSSYKEALLTCIESDNLPRFLGGTCTSCGAEGCEHSDIGPWNDGSVEGYPKEEFERIQIKYGGVDIYRHLKNKK